MIYPIDANNGTPTRDWPMVIYGYIELPTGPVWVSSQLSSTSRSKSRSSLASSTRPSATQGEAVDIVLNSSTPGSGKARAK